VTARKSTIITGSGGAGKGIVGILALVLPILAFLIAISPSDLEAASSKPALESNCWFLRDSSANAPAVVVPSNLKSTRIAGYFRIFYAATDPLFSDQDRDGVPEILRKNEKMMEQSRHLLQTELGWKMPISQMDGNTPELNVYFLAADRRMGSTTRVRDVVEVVFNRNVLSARDFPALWIHQLTHAVELEYKKDGDYWFYEATAGWMEGQFSGLSRLTRLARLQTQQHPEASLTDPDAIHALGSSRFVEMLARSYKDVIRQIWQNWSYSREETLFQITQKVLELNHLPNLESHMQNYFLLFTATVPLEKDSKDVSLKPFSAVLFAGEAEQSQGGIRLSFATEDGASYSTSILFFAAGEKSGTLAMEPVRKDSWSVLVPFSNLDHYSLVIVNPTASELRGRIQKSFDPAIPAIVEYFRVNPGEDGVQIEWKTARENGVAFWNLYRIQNGQKMRLNDFPIPAAIESEEGIHYMFLDSAGGNYYTLEAITQEGFQSRCAGSESPQQ
jgi:hypothetical protein